MVLRCCNGPVLPRWLIWGDCQACHSLPSNADFLRGAKRKVETPTGRIGTAIVDAHPYRAPVPWILDLDDRTQRHGDGRCGKSMGIEWFATRGRPTG